MNATTAARSVFLYNIFISPAQKLPSRPLTSKLPFSRWAVLSFERQTVLLFLYAFIPAGNEPKSERP